MRKAEAKKGKARHEAGGKISIALPDHVSGEAVFGGGRDEFRYTLHRTWGPGKRVLFILMNPSTGAPRFDDPTVAKCRRYAVAWGFDGLDVGNTFAYRATDKTLLREVADPVGPENDAHLLRMAQGAALVVFAYGAPGSKALKGRGIAVARYLREQAGIACYVLALAKDGTPKHPLYLKDSLQASVWDF